MVLVSNLPQSRGGFTAVHYTWMMDANLDANPAHVHGKVHVAASKPPTPQTSYQEDGEEGWGDQQRSTIEYSIYILIYIY